MSITVRYYDLTYQRSGKGVLKGSKYYDVGNYVSSIQLSGDVGRMFKSCQFTLGASASLGVTFKSGDRIRAYKDGAVFFDGRLNIVSQSGNGDIVLTAHDFAYNLSRNIIDFNTMKYDDKELTLTLLKTKTKHPKYEFVGRSAQDILFSVLAEESRRNNSVNKYYVYSKGSKINLGLRANNEALIIQDATTFDITVNENVENIKTVKSIVGSWSKEESSAASPASSVAKSKALPKSDAYKGPDSHGPYTSFKIRLKQTDKYNDLISKVAAEKNVNPLMIKVIMMMESSGFPQSSSSDGGYGLMQITPSEGGIIVDMNRIYEPEYNLLKSCDFMKDKEGVMKRQNYKTSAKNMAHLWNGWVPKMVNGRAEEYDSAYSAAFEAVYAGFGADPNDSWQVYGGAAKSGDSSATPETKTPVSTQDTEVRLIDSDVGRAKYGYVYERQTMSFKNKTEYIEYVNAERRKLGRPEIKVNITMPGSLRAMPGRRIKFEDNLAQAITRSKQGQEISQFLTTKNPKIWYISEVTHSFDHSGHQMNLVLSYMDEMPMPDYEEPIEQKDKKTSGDYTGDKNSSKIESGSAKSFINKWRISADFPTYPRGGYHSGIDFAGINGSILGTKLPCFHAGVVDTVGWDSGGYGNYIVIKTPDKNYHYYAHLQKTYVAKGDRVQADQIIGLVGATGNVTGPHLHYEVRPPSRSYRGALNPRKFLQGTNKAI